MIYFSSTPMTSGLSVMNTCLFNSYGDGDADRIVCKYFGNPLRACYQKSELFKRGKSINFNLSNPCLLQSPQAMRFAATPATVRRLRVTILTLNVDAASNMLMCNKCSVIIGPFRKQPLNKRMSGVPTCLNGLQ